MFGSKDESNVWRGGGCRFKLSFLLSLSLCFGCVRA